MPPNTPPAQGLDWDALTPTCTGCGTKSGRLNSLDLCPTCVGDTPTPKPATTPDRPARPRRASHGTGNPGQPRPERRTLYGRETEAIALYASGLSIAAVAERLGCGYYPVRTVLVEAGVVTPGVRAPRRKGTNVLEPHAPHVVAAYEAGESLRMVGERYGVDSSTVARLLRAHGVEPRSSGWSRTPVTGRV